jgi:hypothetical protein
MRESRSAALDRCSFGFVRRAGAGYAFPSIPQYTEKLPDISNGAWSMNIIRTLAAAAILVLPSFGFANPFAEHGRLRVSQSGTHLEHADGTPFFFLADTVWTGPALSTGEDWLIYLADRKRKGFTAIQFNMACPWRTATTDREGRGSYKIEAGKLIPNEDFYRQVDARMQSIADAGLLAVPVLVWANKKGDAGMDLSEDQLLTLVTFEVERYRTTNSLFILAGDNRYDAGQAEKWKRIGRTVFGDRSDLLVTTHPTGMNFPWKQWEDEKWLRILGYQSGHGDDAKALAWIHSGPLSEYAGQAKFTKPIINLEPPYEDHNGYQSKKPHPAYHVRRAVYMSLLAAPVAGVTYGGHGVWSWHEKPGETPTDHPSTGIAKVWKEAIALPGSVQMGYVRKFFETLPWTKLRPAPNAVKQATDDPFRFVSAAGTSDGSIYVFYFPSGAFGEITIEPGKSGQTARWFDPRLGEWFDHRQLSPPDTQDWVLVLSP